MPLNTAQRFAWNLAQTLMVEITLFETESGYAAIPSAEFDGDADCVVREYDPFAPLGQTRPTAAPGSFSKLSGRRGIMLW